MATDATGAPTPLGIPKFNTSADAPSGLGGNAQMDAIDALIAARVVKPAGIVTGETSVWNGVSWDRSSVTNLQRASLAQVARKTAGFWSNENGSLGINSAFPDAAAKSSFMYAQLPDDYVSGDITLKARMRSSVGSNNWRMSRITYVFRNGSVYAVIENGVLSTVAVPVTINQGFEYSATILAANVQAGDIIRMDLQRLGADGLDTNTGQGDVDGYWLEYTGRA